MSVFWSGSLPLKHKVVVVFFLAFGELTCSLEAAASVVCAYLYPDLFRRDAPVPRQKTSLM